jgi:hypothetical protein
MSHYSSGLRQPEFTAKVLPHLDLKHAAAVPKYNETGSWEVLGAREREWAVLPIVSRVQNAATIPRG